MNIFIDTNNFLSFYHYSNEDLEELRKLYVLLDNKTVKLFLPEQVIDEFYRNRDNKIADALKRFKEEKLNDSVPQICKEYEEYKILKKSIDNFFSSKAKILERITSDILSHNLKADKIIQELFDKAHRIFRTDKIIQNAKLRFELGNPPGKKKSYGDAVNWESLLEEIPEGEGLFFIADDNDYFSELDKERFSYFLEREWRQKKKSEIIAFRRLSQFFQEKFPHIKLASELEKDILIRNLLTSNSFAQTRNIFEKLKKYTEFTPSQLNEIVLACITNNQVYWIINDEDLKEYFMGIVKGNEDKIDPKNLKTFYGLFKRDKDNTEELELIDLGDEPINLGDLDSDLL